MRFVRVVGKFIQRKFISEMR